MRSRGLPALLLLWLWTAAAPGAEAIEFKGYYKNLLTPLLR